MKKINKVTQKVPLLAVLMFFSAIVAFAKDSEAVCLSQSNEPFTGGTRVMLDTDGNGESDLYMRVPYTDSIEFYIALKDEFKKGTRIIFDDENIVNKSYIMVDYILSINGKDILDLFPDKEELFPTATARRAAAKKAQ